MFVHFHLGKHFLVAGGSKGSIFHQFFYITIIDWKKNVVLRAFLAHSNWINTLRVIPFNINGKITDCLISGSADEKVGFWNPNSGKLFKEFNQMGDRIVMHGMRMFNYEENHKKKYFAVSGGHDIENLKTNIFKIWA